MQIQELFDKLTECYSANRFLLRTGHLPSPAIDTLLQTYFNGAMDWEVSTAPQLKGEEVVLAGAVQKAPFPLPQAGIPGLSATLMAELLPNGEPTLYIVLQQPGHSFLLQDVFATLNGHVQGYFPLKTPKFELYSHPVNTQDFTALQQEHTRFLYNPQLEKDVQRQLYFSAIPDLAAGEKELEWLQEYLPLPADKPFLEGWVNRLDRTADGNALVLWRFMLTTADSGIVTIGNFSLPLRLQLLSLYAVSEMEEEPAMWYNIGMLRLSGVFRYLYAADKEPLQLPLLITWNELRPLVLQMRLQTGNTTQVLLDQFASLLNAANLSGLLPQEVRNIIELVALRELAVDIDVARLKPLLVQATFGMSNTAQAKVALFDNTLALCRPYLIFGLDNTGAQPVLIGRAGGAVEFPGTMLKGELEAEVGLPGYFRAGLAPASGIDVTAFLQDRLPAVIDLKKLYCNELLLEGELNPARLAFRSSLAINAKLEILAARITGISLGFELTGGEHKAATAYLGGTFELFEKVRLLVYGQVSNNGWLLHSSFDTSIQGPLTLGDLLPAGIAVPESIGKLALVSGSLTINTATPSFAFELALAARIDLDTFGSFEFSKIGLAFSKSTQGWAWALELEGGLQLMEIQSPDGSKSRLVDLGGKLSLKGENGAFREMFFEASPGHDVMADIPVLIPYEIKEGSLSWSQMKLHIPRIDLKHDKTEGWSFEAAFMLEFTKLWKPLLDMLHQPKLSFRLLINRTGASLTYIGELIDLVVPAIELPAIGDQPALSLGEGRLRLGDFSIKVAKRLEFSIAIKWYLPEHFNLLLGKQPDGNPRFSIFETWQPQSTSCRGLELLFYATSDLKIGFRIDHLPVKLIEEAAEPGWWAINFGPKDAQGYGEYGSIWIKKSSLDLVASKGEFSFDAGFQVKRDPAIPLDMLKRLLETAGLKGVAAAMADKLPIPYSNPPQLIKDKKLNTEGIKAALGGVMTPALSSAIDSLNAVSQLLERLPDRLAPYLEIHPPTKLEFRLSVKPDGSVLAKFAGEPGLRGLFPMGFGGLAGFELRSFSFGPALGGQVFRLDIDADIDIFDLPSLAVALITPEDAYRYIGNPREFAQTLKLHETTFIIIYQTVVPIVIPFLTNELGFSTYGPGGFGAAASYSLTVPSFDLLKAGKLAFALVAFFRDSQAKMPTGDVSPIDLRFAVKPVYLQLPPWLDNQRIGLPDGLPEVSAYNLVAHVMNGIKFFDPVDTLLSIPIEQRVPAAPVSLVFQGIRFTLKWLISTPYEFVTLKGYERLGLNTEQQQIAMRVLPPAPGSEHITPDTKGVVIVMSGDCSVANASLSAFFCMDATGTRKFATGLYINGVVYGIYQLTVEGFVNIDPPAQPFHLEGNGETFLKLLGVEIFSGSAQVAMNSNEISLSGYFSLLADNPFIYFKGQVNGGVYSDKIILAGNIAFSLLIITCNGTMELKPNSLEFAYNGPVTAAHIAVLPVSETGRLQGSGSITLLWTTISMGFLLSEKGELIWVEDGFSLMGGLLGVKVRLGASSEGLLGTADISLGLINFSLNAFANSGGIGCNGSFSLFPDYFPISVKVNNVGGSISEQGFSLHGGVEVSLTIGRLTLANAGGNFYLDQNGMRIDASTRIVWEYRLVLELKNCLGRPVFAGSLSSWLPSVNFYIDDQAPFLHLGTPACGWMMSDAPPLYPAFDDLTQRLMHAIDGRATPAQKEDLYSLTIDLREKGNSRQISIQVERSAGNDIFDEVAAFLVRSNLTGQLELSGARLEIGRSLDEDSAPAITTLILPAAQHERFRKISFQADLHDAAAWYNALFAALSGAPPNE